MSCCYDLKYNVFLNWNLICRYDSFFDIGLGEGKFSI